MNTETVHEGELELVSSLNKRLRTHTVRGTFQLPEVGKPFRLTGESLTPGAAFRLVQTSPVVEVWELVNLKGVREFKTESGSVYRVRLDKSEHQT